MSLFGTSPPNESPSLEDSSVGRSRNSLFDEDDGPMTRSTSDTLFNDDEFDGGRSGSPWDLPTPRKQYSRADLVKSLLAGTDVPDSYIEVFDSAIAEDGEAGRVTPSGVTKTLAAARLSADNQARIMGILAPAGSDAPIGRNEFNVLLALIGLAQQGEPVSLDGVDECRRSKLSPWFPVLSITTILNPDVYPPAYVFDHLNVRSTYLMLKCLPTLNTVYLLNAFIIKFCVVFCIVSTRVDSIYLSIFVATLMDCIVFNVAHILQYSTFITLPLTK